MAKLIPRRRGTWVEVVPDMGESFRLPCEALPAEVAEGAVLGDGAWARIARLAAYHGLYDYALKALARREHFERELYRKLELRERDRSLVAQALSACRERGYLDDARAAEAALRRQLAYGRMGRARLKDELIRRGCPIELARQAIEAQAGGIDEAAEIAALLNARRQHFARMLTRMAHRLLSRESNPARRRALLSRQLGATVIAFLAQRGFMGDEARERAREFVAGLIGEIGEDDVG